MSHFDWQAHFNWFPKSDWIDWFVRALLKLREPNFSTFQCYWTSPCENTFVIEKNWTKVWWRYIVVGSLVDSILNNFLRETRDDIKLVKKTQKIGMAFRFLERQFLGRHLHVPAETRFNVDCTFGCSGVRVLERRCFNVEKASWIDVGW